MALHAPPVITKVEVEAALMPEPGETVEHLSERARRAGYDVKSVETDRVIVLHLVEQEADNK